nr:hypothetical protein [Chryseobacterium sp. 7]
MAIKKHKERIAQQLEELWDYAEGVTKDELQNKENIDFQEIDSEKVTQNIEKINKVCKIKRYLQKSARK